MLTFTFVYDNNSNKYPIYVSVSMSETGVDNESVNYFYLTKR